MARFKHFFDANYLDYFETIQADPLGCGPPVLARIQRFFSSSILTSWRFLGCREPRTATSTFIFLLSWKKPLKWLWGLCKHFEVMVAPRLMQSSAISKLFLLYFTIEHTDLINLAMAGFYFFTSVYQSFFRFKPLLNQFLSLFPSTSMTYSPLGVEVFFRP